MYGVLVPIGGGDDISLRLKELTLGRSENCDIVLRFSNVSGRHCRLVLNRGYWYVVDLASTNGVKVNSYRVYDQRVDPGVRVSFAGHDYYLHYDPLANGALGVVPPDMLEPDILGKSLLERAGLIKQGKTGQHELRGRPQLAQRKIDYEALSLDDIDFS